MSSSRDHAQMVGSALEGEHGRNWWNTVVGEGVAYQPAVLKNIKHLHPITVAEVFAKHRGTEVADVIVGLIFRMAIADNRSDFFIQQYQSRAKPTVSESSRDEQKGPDQ